jgi:hypothetical protein
MSARQFSRELRFAQERGAVIAASAQPFRGQPVLYRPRSSRDPQPWLLEKDCTVRFSGRACHAERYRVEKRDRSVKPYVVFVVVDGDGGRVVASYSELLAAQGRSRDLNYPEV